MMFDGMLDIYKEAGYTSSDVVARLRGILHMKKIGHTGTLDPDAQGVLPVCLGNATRLCDLIADRDKEYRAVMRLGVTTDTQDMSGEVLSRMSDEEVARMVTPEKISDCAGAFTGEILQIPPMYSAVKVHGKRLYQLAREGRTVERKPRPVHIFELEIEKIALPLVTMRVRCSKGTYIRTLCEDMGRELGTGGAMESLLRTRVGNFRLDEARKLDEIEALMREGPEKVREILVPVDAFFDKAPRAYVRDKYYKYLLNGNPLFFNQVKWEGQDPLPADGMQVRIYDERGNFYALYRCDAAAQRLCVIKMFVPSSEAGSRDKRN